MSDSLLPYELKPTRLLCPWNSPGKNTGVGCHFLLWGIFPTQESNLCLLHLLHWEAGSFYHWDTQEAQSVSCYIELFWVIFNSDLCVHCCSVVIITTEIICTVWMFPSYAYSSPSLLDMSSKHRPQSVSSVQFSSSVVSDSLQQHGLQHARLPCPSPTHRAYSNSCSLSHWCHPTISSSVILSPPAFNLSHHQGLFKWVPSSHQVARVLELQL